MAKRFTDSRKWDDPFFRKLSANHKLFWCYILDKCNHAGIWKVDFEMAEFCMGIKINAKNIIKIFKSRIYPIRRDKWFIPKFIEFQYGVLNKEIRCHKSVIELLKKEGLTKGLSNPLVRTKDKDKDKDKDNEVTPNNNNSMSLSELCKQDEGLAQSVAKLMGKVV